MLNGAFGNVFSTRQNQPNPSSPNPGNGVGPASVGAFRGQAQPANSTGQPVNLTAPKAQSATQPVAQQQSAPAFQQGVNPNQTNAQQAIPYSEILKQLFGGGLGSGQMDPLSGLLRSLGVYMFPQIAQQAQFAAGLEPGRESAVTNFINQLSPASQQAQVNTFGNQASQNAAEGAQQAGSLQRAAGLGTGYQAGNAAAAGQTAANAKNLYQQQVMSPQYQQQLLSSLLGGYGQGQSIPGLQNLEGLNSQLLQQEHETLANQTGNPIWSGLSGIAGSLAGGGAFNGLLGGL